MKKFYVVIGLVIGITASIGIWYSVRQQNRLDNWSRIFYGVGTNSSPGVADLNGDGILDIVLGTGGKEFEAVKIAVLALDGSNADTLWTVEGRNQMVGSAVFKDITGDGVPDVFIGGRSAQFIAINGLTGDVLWEYLNLEGSTETLIDTIMLNFFNPQFIPDQNEDGVEDILTAFGGYVIAEANDTDRPPGKLVVLDTKTGKVLIKSNTPDEKEIYMSPVVYDFGEGLTIIFGTGGETIRGKLYGLLLDDLMISGTQQSIQIDSGINKGFIAPPIIADVTRDGVGDIIVTTMDGYMKSYDGHGFSALWSRRIHARGETQSMPAPLHFDNDDVLDFFGSFNIGQWPKNDTTIHVILSGVDGRELFRDSLGMLQFSSPISADFNGDSHHDIVYPVNIQMRNVMFPIYKTQLMLYDGKTGIKTAIDSLQEGKILGSTPMITDLDGDGKLDLIYTFMTQFDEFLTYRDLVIKRMEFDIDITENSWGGYMGTDHTSIFQSKHNLVRSAHRDNRTAGNK